jgi:vacuolar-type H+-ATPase subunit I/STV1
VKLTLEYDFYVILKEKKIFSSFQMKNTLETKHHLEENLKLGQKRKTQYEKLLLQLQEKAQILINKKAELDLREKSVDERVIDFQEKFVRLLKEIKLCENRTKELQKWENVRIEIYFIYFLSIQHLKKTKNRKKH